MGMSDVLLSGILSLCVCTDCTVTHAHTQKERKLIALLVFQLLPRKPVLSVSPLILNITVMHI